MKKSIYFLTLLLTALFLLPWSGMKATTPFTEGFESSTLPSTWSTIHVSGSSSYVWKTYMNNYYVAPHGGSYSAFHSYASGGANNYLITPQLSPVAGETLRFYIASQNYTGTTVTIEVAVANSTPTSASDFTTVLATYKSSVSINTSWALKEFDLSAYAGNNIYIAFHAVDANGGNIYIDDVSIVAPVTCPKPTGLNRTSLSATSATFTWTAGGEETSWQYICLPAATAIDWTDSNVQTTSNATATISGLSANTDYKFYVRANCGSDQSEDVILEFTTPCVAQSLPLTENFGSSNACWTKVDCHSETGVTSGEFKFRYTTTPPQYLITPELEASAKAVQVKFDYRVASSSWPESFKVGYSTTTNAISEFTWGDELTGLTNTSYTATSKYSEELPSGVKYVAIMCTSDDKSALFIDNFEIKEVSSCIAPTGLTCSGASSNSATLSWTIGKEGDDAWVVEYSTASNFSGSSEVPATTNSSFNLTGLTAETTYYVRVKTKCGETEFSDPSDAINFTTPCAAVDLPLEENFSSALGSCWKRVACETDSKVADGVFAFKYNTNPPQYLITPEFKTYNKEVTVEFKYKAATTSFTETFYVGYSTTTNDVTSAFTWGDELSCNQTSFEDYSNTFPANVKYIAIKYTANDQHHLYIDDLKVKKVSTCLAPTDLACSAKTKNSATLSWTKGNDSDDAWVVEYSTASNFSGSTEVPATTNSSFVLSGLSAQTTYYVRVKTKCGESEYSDPSDAINFTTACNAQAIPFNEDFSGSISCWTMIDCTSGTGKDGSAFKFYFNTTPPQYLISPELEASAKAVQVAFDYKVASTMFEESFKVGYSTTTNAISAFTWGTEQTGLTNTSYTNYAETLPAGVKYVAIQYTANDKSALYIDNFSVSVAPSCFAPTGLSAATSITPEGATFTWSASGHGEDTYQWAVAVGSAAPEWVDDDAHKVAATTKTLTGLTPNTSYKFYVRSYCDSEDQSAHVVSAAFIPVLNAPTDLAASALTASGATISWTGAAGVSNYEYSLREGDVYLPDWDHAVAVNGATSVDLTELNPSTTYSLWVRSVYNTSKSGNSLKLSFTTKCEAVAVNATYTENFNSLDNGAIPACWDNSEGTTTSASYKWKAATGGQSGKCLVFNGTDNGYGRTNILATPTFTLSSDADLVFYWKNAKTGAYKVQISVDGAAREDLITGLVSQSSWTKAEQPLTSYNGHSVQFFFCGTSANDGSANLYLDEFQIVPVSCRKPASLDVDTVTAKSATIYWSRVAADANYEYSIDNSTWTATTDTFAIINDLDPITNYTAYVRRNCGEENYSEVMSVEFKTECGVYSAPFSEDFNNAESGYEKLPDCWADSGSMVTSSYKWHVENNGGRSGKYLRCTSAADEEKTNILVSPKIELTAGNVLTFWCKKAEADNFIVKVTKDEGTNFTQLLDLSSAVLADWTLQYADLSAFAGETVEFYFCNTTSGQGGTIGIDDVRVAKGVVYKEAEVNTFTATDEAIDVVMARTLLFNGDYNTLCLPFSLSAEQLEDADCPLNNFKLKVFDYSAVVNDELQIAIAGASSIEAGVPYFVSYLGATEANKSLHLFKDVQITAAAAGSKTSGQVTYQGVLNKDMLADQSNNSENPAILYLGAGNTIYWPAGELTIKGFRAYFSINYLAPASAPVRPHMSARIVERAEGTTGCENVQADAQTVKFLENNQVVIIRNGVKYNIQGQVISK